MNAPATLETIYDCTPRQVTEFIEDCIYAGLVPFVKSSPGMGKSSLMSNVANKLALEKIDHRVSSSDPTDFNGLPGFNDGKAMFMPFEEIFPLEGTPLPQGKQGWMLFLDEVNAGAKMVQAAMYKLVLDKMVGQHKLHNNVAITMAGNLDTDGAITNRIGTALQSRVVHIKMRTDFNEWMEDVARPQDYDHRIIAYLNWKKDALNDFRPDHTNDTFCCQRTWEFMNNLIKDKPILDSKVPLYVGTISPGVAVDFVQFSKVFESIPDIKEVVNNPAGQKVPHDAGTRWAVVSSLAHNVKPDIFAPICEYIDRFGVEGRILFYRSVIAKHPSLHNHPAYRQALVSLSQYLHT